MATIILNKREASLFRNNGNPNEECFGVGPRQQISDAVNTLASHLGGNGIDLLDEEGNDLSEGGDKLGHYTFSYVSPFPAEEKTKLILVANAGLTIKGAEGLSDDEKMELATLIFPDVQTDGQGRYVIYTNITEPK